MPVIGLTGGIATGKSEVSAELRSLGAVVLSADEAAHAVTAPDGPALPGIAARFGESVLQPDGSLDRRALATRVFADPAERHALEELTHPHILRVLREQIDAALRERPDAVVVVEVPLLYEAGLRAWFDWVIVVAAREDTQVERLCRERGMSTDESIARIRSQFPIADKVADADYTIWNDDNRAELSQRTREAMLTIRSRFAVRGTRSRHAEKGACANKPRVL